MGRTTVEDLWRWGEGTKRFPSTRAEKVRRFLGRKLNHTPTGRQSITSSPSVRPSRLDDSLFEGVAALTVDDLERLKHSFGKSYNDLLSLRNGVVTNVTDAVAFPRSSEEVQELVDVASKEGIAVVPWSGGTSVVGGLEPIDGGHRAVLTISLEKMNLPLWIDESSKLAHFQCGIRGPELEGYLNGRGLTLGHFPQSFEFSTLGGWIATRSSGQNSTHYGEISARVRGATIVTPQGTIRWEHPVAMAAGPSLDELFVGSEGALGIFTEATVDTVPLPERTLYHGVLFSDWERGVEALSELSQDSPAPALLRLSDPAETELTMVGREDVSTLSRNLEIRYMRFHGLEETRACLGLVGYEGTRAEVESGWRNARRVISRAKALDAGTKAGEAWKRERFMVPYLRDDLIDDGYMVETLETGCSWRNVMPLYECLLEDLNDAADSLSTPLFVGAHLSHAGRSGTCIYMTLISPQRPGEMEEPLTTLKKASMRSILSHGGSLSHHHGIGTLHRPWTREYFGPLSAGTMVALKKVLDPHNIMNPGKTIPPETPDG